MQPPKVVGNPENPAGLPVIVTQTAAANSASRRGTVPGSRRRRSSVNRVRLIGMFAVCLLVLIAALATFLMTRMPRLTGELAAGVLDGDALDANTIPWTQLDLPPDDRDLLQRTLAEKPDTFRSDQMVCSFTATNDGIRVELRSGEATRWVVVDGASRPQIALWIQNNLTEVDAARRNSLQSLLNEYVQLHLQIARSGGGRIEPARFRDGIGLTVGCSVLGFAVEATTGSRVIRCAAQDHLGRLYFAIPRDVNSFTLRGRSLDDGSRPFPGVYEVHVDPAQVVTGPRPPSDPTETDALDADADMPVPGTADPGETTRDMPQPPAE